MFLSANVSSSTPWTHKRGMTRTLRLLCRLHLLADLKGLPGVYDINNSARSRGLKVLEEDASMTSICVGRVDALCREVVKLLEVGVPSWKEGSGQHVELAKGKETRT